MPNQRSRSATRVALTVQALAAVAHLSPRQFSRAFVMETGETPAKAVERLRLEAARFMMEEGRRSINEVADDVGFANRERMRRAFVRAYGVPPLDVRLRDTGSARLSPWNVTGFHIVQSNLLKRTTFNNRLL